MQQLVKEAANCTSLITSCRNLKGGFLSKASVSFGFLTRGVSPCNASCVGSQKLSDILLKDQQSGHP